MMDAFGFSFKINRNFLHEAVVIYSNTAGEKFTVVFGYFQCYVISVALLRLHNNFNRKRIIEICCFVVSHITYENIFLNGSISQRYSVIRNFQKSLTVKWICSFIIDTV